MPTAIYVEVMLGDAAAAATDNPINHWLENLHQGPISLSYFPAEAKISIDHVRSAFGDETLDKSKDHLKELVQKATQVREDARNWGLQQVESMIMKHFQKLGHNDIGVWSQFLTMWKKADYDEGIVQLAAEVWKAVHGEFDVDSDWSGRLENEHMKIAGLKCPEGHMRRKECCHHLFLLSARVAELNR